MAEVAPVLISVMQARSRAFAITMSGIGECRESDDCFVSNSGEYIVFHGHFCPLRVPLMTARSSVRDAADLGPEVGK